MTSRRHYNPSRHVGMMMLDIILATALAAVFVSGLAASSLDAREIFDRARTRSELMVLYEAHKDEFRDLMPYEIRERSYGMASSSEPAVISAAAQWYGNDRIETDLHIAHGRSSVVFRSVRAYPYASPDMAIGTPLCSPERPPGISITPIMLPINPLLPLTDIEVRDDVAYVSADPARSSDPDFMIFDIYDPEDAKLLSSISTGPGIVAFALAGKDVYAAAASTVAQLHVIRVDSLNSLTVSNRYKLPLPEASTSPPLGSAIFFDRGRVYLGTEKWDGEELAVIDVSDPGAPVKVGGFETGSKVNDTYVRDMRAYVSASDRQQLRVLDVADPARLVLIEAYDPSGWERQEGKVAVHFEDSSQFGRTAGGFNVKADHELFLWPQSTSTTPGMPITSLDIPGGVYGIVPDRRRLYVASRTINRELIVLDLPLTATSSARYYPLPVAPQAMTCDRHKIYILARTAPVIYEITTHDEP